MSDNILIKEGNNDSDIISKWHDYNINLNSREIFLSSEQDGEGLEGGINYQSSNKTLKNLILLNNIDNNNILIHLNSQIGGEWDYGLSIYDAIKTSNSTVNIVAYGMMASMSSLILQAGKHRVISPSGSLMIHWGENAASNTHPRANLSQSKWFELINKKMIGIYAERCKIGKFFKGKSLSFVKKFITDKINENEDWYLTSEEALKYGFVDGILGKKTYPTINDVKNAT